MPQYLGIAVTILAVLVGIGVNLLIAGMFFGRVTTELKNLTANMLTLAAKVQGFDSFSEQSQVDRAQLGARMIAMENAMVAVEAKVGSISDNAIRFQAQAEAHAIRSREVQDSQERAIHGINRQLANITTGRHGALSDLNSPA